MVALLLCIRAQVDRFWLLRIVFVVLRVTACRSRGCVGGFCLNCRLITDMGIDGRLQFLLAGIPRGKTAIGITTGAAMETVKRGRRGTLTAGWTTISSFIMRQSKIRSWDRRAFTAIIPPSGPWT